MILYKCTESINTTESVNWSEIAITTRNVIITFELLVKVKQQEKKCGLPASS